MLRQARIAIVSLLLLGCGGSSSNPRDASGIGGGGAGGISVTGTGGIGGAGTGGSGTGNTAGATPTGLLVFQGNNPSLLDRGPACTWEEGATGDRWCAFFVASVGAPGGVDLFAVNATQAAAGVSITCGLTDANCLKLTSSFFGDALHPARFSGDTLVYYDMAGTPFGWRPGMPAGRALAAADPSTRDVVFCSPDTKGTAVTCLRDLPLSMQTIPQNLLSDLLAGRIDGAANPPLARVETVISFSETDMRVIHFQTGFPVPGGNVVAWSARSAAGGPEVLKAQTLGDDASRVTVASNVNAWRASPDGARWYWLSQVNESTGAGTLQSAPFPAGTSPTPIAANTVQYEFPTPTSMVTVDTGRQLLAFSDPAGAPTTSQPLDTGVLGVVNMTKLGHVAYLKAVITVGQTDFTNMFLKKVDGSGACTITSGTDALWGDFIFTPSASGVAWIQRTTSVGLRARFTRLSDCTAMDVASGAAWIEPAGERGVVTLEGWNSTARAGTLQFRPFAAGGAVAVDPATRVSGQVRTFWVASSPASDAIVYTVNGGGNEDGVYVRSAGP
jgi:hypothetical protein